MVARNVFLLLLIPAAALVSSCTINSRLFSQGNPDRVLEADGSPVWFGAQKFDTLTPTLRWSPFIKHASIFDRTPVEVNNLRYHLVVYRVSTLADYRFNRFLRRADPEQHQTRGNPAAYIFTPGPDIWFIEKTALTENSYIFSSPLQCNATYVWSVSASYEYDDEMVQNVNWLSLNDMQSNLFLYSFTTPEKPCSH